MSSPEEATVVPVRTGPLGSSRRDFLLVTVVALSAVLPFLLAPIRAQILGPSGRGEFAFFQSSVTTAGIFAALGLRFACYQLNYIQDNRFRFRTPRLAVYSLAGAMFVIVPTSWIAFTQLSPVTGLAVAAAILLAPGSAIVQIETANANFTQRRGRIAAVSSSPPVLEFFGTLLLVVVQRFNLLVAIVTTIMAELLRSILAVVWHLADRRSVSKDKTTADPLLERRIVAASIRSAPAVVIPLLSGNLDILLFGLFTESAVLGQYAVAKLGFSAMLIAASVLEGRFLAAFRRRPKGRAVLGVVLVALALALLSGAAGFILTPVLFGSDFVPSSLAFPCLALAGCLAFIFSCLSADAAQHQRNSAVPGGAILLTLVVSCIAVPIFVGTDVVSLTWALIAAQFVGTFVIMVQLSKADRNGS